jgi:hypothetical protein
LRAHHPALAHDVELSVLPSQPTADATPRYVLLVATTSEAARAAPLDERAVSASLDAMLCDLNAEWRAKRESGRLAPIEVVRAPYPQVAAALDRRTEDDADVAQRAWESQFKLNPLTRVRFEELASKLGR